MTPDVCPNCDAPVPRDARACPGCGADAATGWSQQAHCDRLGIPDPEAAFDYGEFVRAEFGPRRRTRRPSVLVWAVTLVLLLALLLAWAL